MPSLPWKATRQCRLVWEKGRYWALPSWINQDYSCAVCLLSVIQELMIPVMCLLFRSSAFSLPLAALWAAMIIALIKGDQKVNWNQSGCYLVAGLSREGGWGCGLNEDPKLLMQTLRLPHGHQADLYPWASVYIASSFPPWHPLSVHPYVRIQDSCLKLSLVCLG